MCVKMNMEEENYDFDTEQLILEVESRIVPYQIEKFVWILSNIIVYSIK